MIVLLLGCAAWQVAAVLMLPLLCQVLHSACAACLKPPVHLQERHFAGQLPPSLLLLLLLLLLGASHYLQ
jgi:hypothetical protein